MLKSPVGTLTFLMTDIEGSTRLWEEYPAAMTRAIVRSEQIIHEAVSNHDGYHVVEQGEGDSTLSVFNDATQALHAADEIRQHLAIEKWPDGLLIRVRIGLHSGVADMRQQTYYGRVVNRAARVRAVAHGGQIIFTRATRELLDAHAFPTVKDHGPHRLKDLLEPEHLFELAGAYRFPPILTLAPTKTNLPELLTPFVGRVEALAEIAELKAKNRLITFAGAGGSGKTRLAMEAAVSGIEAAEHGVWFVDLAPLTSEDKLESAVSFALGWDESKDVAELVDKLRSLNLVLILDNCERVVAQLAPIVIQVVRACPSVTIFATSRQPLGVHGEMLYRVPSLGVPTARQSLNPATCATSESVQLFVDRARRQNPDFSLRDSNTEAVGELCRRLDGIPLAIEQAAAMTAYLTPHEISDRLAEKFKVLNLADRSNLPRHRTLRAALDWSYEMLSLSERSLFRRIAGFAAGFSLDAAEQICATETLCRDDVFGLLQGLVDKSLVLALPD